MDSNVIKDVHIPVFQLDFVHTVNFNDLWNATNKTY